MNLVDSSGWLEFFMDGKNAEVFHEPVRDVENLIVPTVVLYEVFKVVLREKDESTALNVAGSMQQGRVIELDSQITLKGAGLSLQYKIPMADSLILATGQLYEAIIWTQDIDFKNLPGVKFYPKLK